MEVRWLSENPLTHRRTLTIPWLALLLAGCLSSKPASAAVDSEWQPLTDRPGVSEWLVAAKPGARSEQEAAKLATRQYGGKVLRVQRKGKHYEVRMLLDDGRVKHVYFAAANGSG